MPRKLLLSWSTGKDSAWTLHVLRQDPRYEVVGLVTTLNVSHDRVAMHAVRRTLLEQQAAALDLPLHVSEIPHPCSNEVYEEAFLESLRPLLSEEIRAIAFGDLFLEDIRAYRERLVAKLEVTPVFPLWELDTRELAHEMVGAGLRARLTCIDPRACPRELVGRDYDAALLKELPDVVDPCGENGEFHTFAYAGPMFSAPIPIQSGEVPVEPGEGLGQGRACEPPVELVRPRVVRAHEGLRVPGSLRDLGAAMATDAGEHADGAVVSACDHELASEQVEAEEVPGLRDLLHAARAEPLASEQALDLARVDRGRGEGLGRERSRPGQGPARSGEPLGSERLETAVRALRTRHGDETPSRPAKTSPASRCPSIARGKPA